MGVSSKKSKQTNTPVYDAAVTGAANDITSAYRAAQPGLQAGADKFSGVLDSVLARYNAGDPTITAARGYTNDVLNGKYLDEGNPYLQGIIDTTNNSVRNQSQAALGTRGLTGGSDYAGIIARALADNETGLRFNNYNTERDRMGQAVSQVPGLIASENAILDPAFQAYDAMQAPVRAAVGAGQGVGGLLGQYQTVKTKQSSSLGGILAQLAGNAAQAYAAGGG